MKISVFGLGYVGAVSCGCLPQLGHEVIGVDTNPLKVSTINAGQSPVVEDGINELIEAAVNSGKLRAMDYVEAAVLNSDVSLISVATPSKTPTTAPTSPPPTPWCAPLAPPCAKKPGHFLYHSYQHD